MSKEFPRKKTHTWGQALNVSILGGMLQNDAVLRVMMQNP